MPEITDFATIVLVLAAGFAVAILATQLTDRLPIPGPAVFLVAAAAISTIWPGIRHDVQIPTVERVAVVALIVVLFNGGMDIGWRRMRSSLGPVLSVGILGTFVTAAVVAALAHWALGFSWTLAGIVGAALAPTDPAVVFSVLGRREIAGRSGTTLEGEAGVNDPAGIALMLGMIELATHADANILVVVREFAVEMGVGAACGAIGAFVLVPLLRRLRLASEGLYPVLALVLAAVLYGATTLAHGSGFLAVFIAGLFLGDARTPYKHEIERFQGALGSLAEIVVFIVLGLTVDLTALPGDAWTDGIVLLGVLALLARPIAVLLTLTPARLTRSERVFVTWSGLKGAVPILLAAFAVLSDVPGAQPVYGVVFVVVLLSVAIQGTLVPAVAGWLRIPMHERPRLPWAVGLRLGREPQGVRELRVAPGSRAANRAIGDLELAGAWIALVVRDGHPLEANGALELHAGDRALVLAPQEGGEDVDRLFTGG